LAVPHTAFLGRATYANRKLVALSDRIFPRGTPSLRPLTTDELVREDQATLTNLAPSLQLALLLTMEYSNPNSSYRPWLDLLPKPPVSLQVTSSSPSCDNSSKAGSALMNAAFLDSSSSEKLLREGHKLGLFKISTAELNAMSHELSERMGAFHQFVDQTIRSHFVLKTMIERVAAARFRGDQDAARSLFRWALSMVESRANDGHNLGPLDPESPLARVDPWAHLKLHQKSAATTSANGEKELTEEEKAVERDKALDELPMSVTPSIAPFLDFINHAGMKYNIGSFRQIVDFIEHDLI
jgi:hypothetical protein